MRFGLLRAIPAAALAIIATWEVVRTERAGAGVPDDDAWKQASDVVRMQWKPGDLIVFAPGWIDPVGRLWLGDLISIDDAARMDGERYGSVWELSIRGAHAPETERGDVDREIEVDGGVTVRHVTRPAVQVATDFVAAFPGAKVAGGGAHVELAEVGFAPHRCVEATPGTNAPVTITYPQAALGTQLVGYVGLADAFAREQPGRGRLTVAIGGKEVAHAEVGDDDGWVRFAAPTTAGAADVTITATAVGADARQRLVCFAAEARR